MYHIDLNSGKHYLAIYLVGIWGFPKIRSTLLGVPIIRTRVFGGLYWGPLFQETPV